MYIYTYIYLKREFCLYLRIRGRDIRKKNIRSHEFVAQNVWNMEHEILSVRVSSG